LEGLAEALNAPVRDFFDGDASEKTDPKREALVTASKMSTRSLTIDDLSLVVSILDLMARRDAGRASGRRKG
jgi:hypothetical protein